MVITTDSIMSVLGIIATMGCAITYMYKFQKKAREPIDNINQKLERHDKCLQRDDTRLRELESDIRKQTKGIDILLEGQLSILEHLQTGNSTGEMKKAHSKTTDYLIHR